MSADPRDTSRRVLGARGEAAAAAWYLDRGAELLDQNWRDGRRGEIDLVLRVGSTVVFCEVKTRASTAFGHPAEAVTRAKQVRIRRLAAAWFAQSGVTARRARFDVAAVIGGKVEVIEAAF